MPSIRAAHFLIGMLCASLEQRGRLLRWPDPWMSAATVLLLGSVAAFCRGAYAPVPALLLGLAFFAVVSGASVFGLLLSRPARRLGEVSYSVYLLQGIVLAVSFSVPGIRSYAALRPENHWLAVLACGTALAVASAAAFVLVERPGIRLGARVASLAAHARPARGRRAASRT